MEPQIEQRFTPGIEIREEDGRPPQIVGYAAVFDSPSLDLGGFTEIVRAGAFAATLKRADVRALVDHDPGRILGRRKGRVGDTLRLHEDEKGLRVEIDTPDTTAGRDVVESIRRRDIDGMSFGFRTVTDTWHVEKKKNIRELQEVELHDVAVVAFPAYPATQVKVRALAGGPLDVEELEALLVRMEHGLDLSGDDRALAVRMMTILTDATKPEGTPRLDAVRSRLQEKRARLQG